jgi:hypothetical protein
LRHTVDMATDVMIFAPDGTPFQRYILEGAVWYPAPCYKE